MTIITSAPYHTKNPGRHRVLTHRPQRLRLGLVGALGVGGDIERCVVLSAVTSTPALTRFFQGVSGVVVGVSERDLPGRGWYIFP